MRYIPKIGDAGRFTLLPPYSEQIVDNHLYTVNSIRCISDYTALGEDAYAKFYLPFNISKDDYEKDIQNDVLITGLQAGTGEWVYIPSSYIDGHPEVNGIKYIPLVLGISLGPVNDNYNLDSVIKNTKDIVKKSIGIEPEVRAVMVGSAMYLTKKESDILEEVRERKKEQLSYPELEIQRLKDKVATLEKIKEEYETIFKATLTN